MGTFVIGEVEVVGEVSLAPSAALYDGAVVADGDRSVRINQFFYDLAGTKGKYLGSVGNAVTDNTTSYVYLDASAALVINTTGYPGTTHIRLARVIAAGGIITRVVLERAFLTASGVAATPKTDTLIWGNDGVGTSTTARYLVPGYSETNAPTTASPAFRVPSAGTIRNFRVRHNIAGVGGATITYTLRKNGATQALTCGMPATSLDANDLVNSFTVAAGDLVDLIITKSAAITTSPQDVLATVEFAP